MPILWHVTFSFSEDDGPFLLKAYSQEGHLGANIRQSAESSALNWTLSTLLPESVRRMGVS